MTWALSIWLCSRLSAWISYSLSSPGLRQCAQSLRTSRWAMMARMEVATRKGLMPMSTRRATAPGASFVCRVLKTRCPVRLALMAMLAVSRSRISPIMMMFGAWRSMDRSAAGNVMPMSELTCTWLMPLIWYSTGSSTVMILRSGWLM